MSLMSCCSTCPAAVEATAPQGDLPDDRLQPESLADTVAALIHQLGPRAADVLGFSYARPTTLAAIADEPTTSN